MAPNNVDNRRRFFLPIIQASIIAFVLLVFPAPVLARSNIIIWNNLVELDDPAFRDDPTLRSDPAVRGFLENQDSISNPDTSETALPEYKNFIKSVENGQKGMVRGVYVPGVFALPIVQQPVGYGGYVSPNNGEITQFSMAAEAGNIGLLAHNNLSGANFVNLAPGQEIRLVYGDGAVEYFTVDQVLKYQALQPFSPSSQFRDLETDVVITAEELFRMVYRGERHVTFQTCIEANGVGSWGRLFIIAQPKTFPYIEQKYILENLLPTLY